MSTSGPTEERLARVPLFANLRPGPLKKLARLCIPRTYPGGEFIIEEGSVGLGLFLITSGRVEVLKGSAQAPVSLALLGPGGVLGEMAVLDDAPRSASARAVEDTECLLLTRDGFQTLLRDDPEIAWCLVPVLTGRLRDLQARLIGAERDAPAAPPAALSAEEQVATASAEAAPAAAPARSDAGVRLMRTQYAALMAGIAGIEEVVRVGASFLRRLARETGLEEPGRAAALARRIPAGLAAASREALTEAEKAPERVVASFLRHFKRDPK